MNNIYYANSRQHVVKIHNIKQIRVKELRVAVYYIIYLLLIKYLLMICAAFATPAIALPIDNKLPQNESVLVLRISTTSKITISALLPLHAV